MKTIIAERLSARLLILQCVFSVGEVWLWLPSCFRNAIEGVVCAQTSVPLRNAIKICLKKSCVHLRKFIALTTVVVLAVSLSWETTISLRSVQLKNMLTFSNSFIIGTLCLPSHSSFVAHAWLTVPKARATHTNSNPHMLVQRSWRCARGIHCENVHL